MDNSTALVSGRRSLFSSESNWFGWFIVILGATFYCYEYLLRVSPGVMTSHLMSAYNLDAKSYGNLSACYYYIYSPMQLFVGLLMDRFGPRKLLTFACVCCAAGIYLFAATPFLHVAQAGRVLIGLGSAFAFVGVLKLASIWLPANRFALISGIASVLGVVGGIMG